MSEKTPFFQSRSRGTLKAAVLGLFRFPKKEAAYAAAAIACAAILMAWLSGGRTFSFLRFWRARGFAGPNASLPVDAQARGVPRWPPAAAAGSQESLTFADGNLGNFAQGRSPGRLAGEPVAALVDPTEAGKRLSSVDLPVRLPQGVSAAVTNVVLAALDSSAAPAPPKGVRKGRFHGHKFSRRYRQTAAPCLGPGCTMRDLSTARLLTAAHSPCLPTQDCVAEDAVADENATYDGSPAARHYGPSPLNQTPAQISRAGAPGLGAQNSAIAGGEAQVLAQDARACAVADALFLGTPDKPGPQAAAQKDFARAYQGLQNSGCAAGGGVGCAASRAQAQELCRQFDAEREAHYQACPLDQSAGPYEPAQCGI